MRIFYQAYLLFLKKWDYVKWARIHGVSIGKNTTVSNTVSFSSEPYLISIGNHVQVTKGVSFFTHGGGNVVRRFNPLFDVFGKIIVEDWCYIGAHSIILPGVTIGEGTLVAAGSVVTKSVPPGVVIAGNPAKIICTVDDYIKKNSKFDIATKHCTQNEKKKILLSLPEEKLIKKECLRM